MNYSKWLIWVGPYKAKEQIIDTKAYDKVLLVEALEECIRSLKIRFSDSKYEVKNALFYINNPTNSIQVCSPLNVSSNSNHRELLTRYPGVTFLDRRTVPSADLNSLIIDTDELTKIDLLIEDRAVVYELFEALNNYGLPTTLFNIYTTCDLNNDSKFLEYSDRLGIEILKFDKYFKLKINFLYFKMLDEITFYRRESSEASKSVQSLTLELDSYVSELGIAKEKLAANDQSLVRLNDEKKQLEKSITAKNLEVTSLKENESKFRYEVLELKNKNDKCFSTVESLRVELSSLEKKAKTINENLVAKEAKVAELLSSNSSLSTLVENSGKENESLKSEVNLAKEQNNALKKSYEEAGLKISNLEAERHKLSSENSQKQNELVERQTENDSIKRELSLSNKSLKEKESELQRLRQSLVDIQETLAKYELDHSELTELKVTISNVESERDALKSLLEKQTSYVTQSMTNESEMRLKNVDIKSIANSLPENDFVNEKFDHEHDLPLEKVVLLLSTPRSGSTMVCSLLRECGYGVAHEYFQPFQYLPILADRWNCITESGLLDKSQYISKLVRHRAKDGVLYINLHESHLHVFDQFRPFFPSCKFMYVLLVRQDTIKQAVSYEIASQTQNWSSDFEQRKEPVYNFEKLLNRYETLTQYNCLLENYIDSRALDYKKLVYEELSAEPISYLNEKLKEVVGFFEVKLEGVKLKKQASELNRVWESKFYTDLRLKNNPNNIGSVSIG